MDGVSQEVVLEPQEQAISPTGWITAASTAGTFELRSDSCGYTCWYYSKIVARRNVHNRPDSAHLATIATGPVLSELRGLRLQTKETLPDIAHETYAADSTVECTYAAKTIQSCSAGKNAEIIPNTLKEAMTLPAKNLSGKRRRTRKWQA